MYVKGTRYLYELKEYVKDNYYARLDTRSYNYITGAKKHT